MPDAMRPKMVCFPSRCAVGPSVMKNCTHATHVMHAGVHQGVGARE